MLDWCPLVPWAPPVGLPMNFPTDLPHGGPSVGPPRSVLPLKYQSIPHVRASKMWRDNTWDFMEGDGHQGLLTYVYLVLRQDFCHTFDAPGRGIWVRHFWSWPKPWTVLPWNARCPHYFRGMTRLRTPCARLLSQRARGAIETVDQRDQLGNCEKCGTRACAECCIGTISRIM